MPIPHAFPGKAADLQPQGELLSEATTFALVKNDAFEVIRMAIRKDHEACHDHSVPGPITIQCLKGWIELTSAGETHLLKAGQWSFLLGGVPHTIKGVEDSLILLTMMFR